MKPTKIIAVVFLIIVLSLCASGQMPASSEKIKERLAHVKGGLSNTPASTNSAIVRIPGMYIVVYHSYESFNNPGWFIRHANGFGELSDFTGEITALDVDDSTFALIPGLADKSCVSFQSKNYPSSYLRHQNGRIKLKDSTKDDSQLFKEDATFRRVPGLADSSGVSFESYNYPGNYLRHREGHLWVEPNDGTLLFKLEATFREDMPRVATPKTEQPEPGSNDAAAVAAWAKAIAGAKADMAAADRNHNTQPTANVVMKVRYDNECCCSDDPRCEYLQCQGTIGGQTWTFMDDGTWWKKSPQEIEGHWKRDGNQFWWSDRSGKVHYLNWADEGDMEGHYSSTSCYNMRRIS